MPTGDATYGAMEFSKKLDKLRKMRRYSQETLGKLVGCSQNAIGKWCRGKSVPTLAMALKLAEALKVDLDYLADDEQDQVPNEPAEVIGMKLIRAHDMSEDEVIWRLTTPTLLPPVYRPLVREPTSGIEVEGRPSMSLPAPTSPPLPAKSAKKKSR